MDIIKKITFLLALAGHISAQTPVTDSLVHLPVNYDNFTPPTTEGGTFVDPVFGTKVTRISDASKILGSSNNMNGSTTNEYSSINAFNADNTLLYLDIGLGGKRIYSVNGGLANIPAPDLYWNSSSPLGLQLRWSHTDPDIMYYVDPEISYYSGPDDPGLSHIKSINVKTGEIKILHTFSQYKALYLTSSDLSPDGDYMTILANGRYAFWYKISTDQVGPIVDRTAPALGYGVGDKGGMQVVGDRFTMLNYAYTSNYTHPFGMLVFDLATMTYQGEILEVDHSDYGIDVDGTPIVIMPGSGYDLCQSNPWYIPGNGGVYSVNKWNLHTLAKTSLGCLPTRINISDFYVSLPAVTTGWALITHVDVPGTYDSANNIYTPSPLQPGWLPFENEIFLLKLDGSGKVKRLVNHRGKSGDFSVSPPVQQYTSRAKATINNDGTKAVFCSNMGLVNPSPTNDVTYADTYMFDIPAEIPLYTSSKNSDMQINIYPNPAQDKIYFETTFQNLKAEIYNSIGEKVLSKSIDTGTEKMLDVSNLSSGIYFIQLSNENNSPIGKSKITIIH